jgi:hypothetical protein
MITISYTTYCTNFRLLTEFERKNIISALGFYMIFDLFLPPNKFEMKIHHLLGSLMCYLAYQSIEKFPIEILKILLNSEISTFFLVFRDLGIRNIYNDGFFFISFTYFRIIKLTSLFITHDIFQYHPFVYLSFIFLYSLNIYWYQKILIKLKRSLWR